MSAMGDSEQGSGRPWWKKKRWLIPIAVVLLGGAVNAAVTEDPETESASAEDSDAEPADAEPGLDEPESDSEPEPEPDESPDLVAESACRHWANVAGDIQSGVLTPGEAREKIQEVHDDARFSETPRVRTAAEDLLRKATHSDDVDELLAAMREMTAACDDVLE